MTTTEPRTVTGRDKQQADETTVGDPTPQQSDLELVEAAIEALTGALPVALSPTQGLAAARRLAGTVIRQPRALTRRGVDLTAQLARVAVGTSGIEPDRKDARFADPAWRENPLYKRLGQSYLAWNRAVHGVVDDLDLDEKSKLRAQFVLKLLTEAVAPTNNLLGNPAALKRARETRGRSLVDGARHMLYDVRNNGAMPSMVDSRPFVLGETIAATPGAVVWKNEIAELIQYTPTTPQVHERPMLVLPPQINKYYVLDLAPGRSMVEHLVAHGHQVFMLSWANPTADDAAWDYDSYCPHRAGGLRRGPGDHRLRRHEHAGCLRRWDHRGRPAGSPGHRRGQAVRHRDLPGHADRLRGALPGRHVHLPAGGGRGGSPEPVRGRAVRPRAGPGVRLVAAQRPGLELLGEQLPDGQEPPGLRRAGLERRRRRPAGGPAR